MGRDCLLQPKTARRGKSAAEKGAWEHGADGEVKAANRNAFGDVRIGEAAKPDGESYVWGISSFADIGVLRDIGFRAPGACGRSFLFGPNFLLVDAFLAVDVPLLWVPKQVIVPPDQVRWVTKANVCPTRTIPPLTLKKIRTKGPPGLQADAGQTKMSDESELRLNWGSRGRVAVASCDPEAQANSPKG